MHTRGKRIVASKRVDVHEVTQIYYLLLLGSESFLEGGRHLRNAGLNQLTLVRSLIQR